MEAQYRLVLKRISKGSTIQLKVSKGEEREHTLVRLGGKNAEPLFKEIVEVLQKHNLIEGESSTATMKAYKVKSEVGPLVAGFLILGRRAKDAKVWTSAFKEALEGKKAGAKEIFSHALSISESLTPAYPSPKRSRMELNPKVIDGVSAGFKVLVRKLWNIKI